LRDAERRFAASGFALRLEGGSMKKAGRDEFSAPRPLRAFAFERRGKVRGVAI
jgi:hypothetical protein